MINFSGHKVEGENIEVVFQKAPAYVNSSWVEGMTAAAVEMAKDAANALKEFGEDCALVLPGRTIIAVPMIVALYRITGKFPNITWPTSHDGQYTWHPEIILDLNTIARKEDENPSKA